MVPCWSHFPSKIDEKIDAKINAEKVMKFHEKSMREWGVFWIENLRKNQENKTEELEDLADVHEDDFDKIYKGEVSKSGVAILPSKRMRKIPIQTTSDNEDKKVEKTTEESESPLKLTEEVEVKEEKK